MNKTVKMFRYDVLRNSTDINVDAIIYLRTDPKEQNTFDFLFFV